MAAIKYVVNFNDFSLQSIQYVNVYAVEDYGADRTLNILALAQRSARKLSSAFYQTRKIQVSIAIMAPSRAAFDIAFDALLAAIQSQEGTLVIEKSGSVRAYTATFSKVAKNNTGIGRGNAQPPKGGFADFTLEFECSDSFGYDTNYTLIANSTLSSGLVNVQYTQGGGADTQAPFIQVQLTAVTGGTAKTITVGNNDNGQTISVTRTWGVNDILQVDSRNKTVQVNGNDVAFSGAFPEFTPGLSHLSYVDNFTTRTYKLYAYVYQRWT